ncbi:MAG: flagellar protein FliS [Bacillales bacterium]|jgi:flagellar protein FliS|nr:flagellar protein FliS [Bacillales bacterium]
MAINNPYASYQQNSVNTASPGDLTLMLYNGCLKFLVASKVAIKNKNVSEKNINIQKAQKILRELLITLDPNYEISKNLAALYDYFIRRLVDGNINNDINAIEEVEEFVTELRDTWKEVIKINRQIQHANSGGVV